jgi:protocatechuate 3,4-dioxygenase beta subunit
VTPQARTQQQIQAWIADLLQVAAKHRLQENELMATLEYLTEVGKRGEFQLLSDVLGLSVLVDGQTHPESRGTQTSVLGPFWRPESPLLHAPARLCGEDVDAEPLFVTGRVTDAETGAPIARAETDVWQADQFGKYDLEYPDLKGSQLRGRLSTDGEGRYAFRTIVPAPYEVPKNGAVGRLLRLLGRSAFRPAHLHLKFEAAGHEPLTTMVFFEGDPHLDHDVIGAVKSPLVRRLERHSSEGELRARGVRRPFATLQFDVSLRPRGRA